MERNVEVDLSVMIDDLIDTVDETLAADELSAQDAMDSYVILRNHCDTMAKALWHDVQKGK